MTVLSRGAARPAPRDPSTFRVPLLILLVGAAITVVLGVLAPPYVALGLMFLVCVSAYFAFNRRDAVSWATLIVVALFLVPVKMVLEGPLKSSGHPSLLLGLGALLLCLVAWTATDRMPSVHQPIRYAVFAVFLVSLFSAAVAYARPLTELEEGGPARMLLQLTAAAGITILVADFTPSLRRLDVLLTRMVLFGSISCALGLVQHLVAGFDVVALLHLPGFTLAEIESNLARDEFIRVVGTASHPIEFGVVAAMLAPFALHYAVTLPRGFLRDAMWVCLAVTVVSLPLAISRAAVIALLVALLIQACGWSWRQRLNLAVAAVIGFFGLRLAFPGVFRSLLNLFLNIGNEPSSQARLTDVEVVEELAEERPWTGLGLGTYNPEQYLFLDNEYFQSLVQGGYPLLVANLALFAVGIATTISALRSCRDTTTRQLVWALLGAQVAFVLAAALFDAFSFRQVTLLYFLLIGAAGAIWRINRQGPVLLPGRHAKGHRPLLEVSTQKHRVG